AAEVFDSTGNNKVSSSSSSSQEYDQMEKLSDYSPMMMSSAEQLNSRYANVELRESGRGKLCFLKDYRLINFDHYRFTSNSTVQVVPDQSWWWWWCAKWTVDGSVDESCCSTTSSVVLTGV